MQLSARGVSSTIERDCFKEVRHETLVLRVAAVLVCWRWPGPAGGRPADPVKPIKLFNGKDLTELLHLPGRKGEATARTRTPRRSSPSQDGMIRVSGEEFGGFTTEKEYENYHLVVEFKWGEKTWPPRETRRTRHRHPAPLRRRRRRGRRRLDGVDRVPDDRGRHRRLHPGRRQEPARRLTVDRLEKPRQAAVLRSQGRAATSSRGGRINWWGRDPDLEGRQGLPRQARRREAGRRVEHAGVRLRRRHDHQHPQRQRRQRRHQGQPHARARSCSSPRGRRSSSARSSCGR